LRKLYLMAITGCAAALGILIAACGSVDGSPRGVRTTDDVPTPLRVEDVRVAFEKVGVHLEVAGTFNGVDTLPVPFTALRPSSESTEGRFGKFTLTVFEDIDTAVTNGVFGDVMQPPTGVVWREPESRRRSIWVAAKLYDNVEVQWRTSTMELDSRWYALDEVLSNLHR